MPDALRFDANVAFRFPKYPNLRFGMLGYAGKWHGDFGKKLLLSDDFTENNWETVWNGFGVEAQYQFRFGAERGGLQTGVRLQSNQFIYSQNKTEKGEANHLAVTPQIGFQWYPFKKLGFYLLPWAGIQAPTSGTDKIMIDGTERATRKVIPVATAHIGWEFKF